MDSHIPYGNHSVSHNTSFGYMKLTNINDNLSNYIFQASVKLSLVVSSVKVGSCHTLEQERFRWEIWKKLVCLRAVLAYTASDQAELQQQGM